MHCSTVYSSLQYLQVWFSLSCAESWVHVGGGVVCQECEGEEERHHHGECLILHVCMRVTILVAWKESVCKFQCLYFVLCASVCASGTGSVKLA